MVDVYGFFSRKILIRQNFSLRLLGECFSSLKQFGLFRKTCLKGFQFRSNDIFYFQFQTRVEKAKCNSLIKLETVFSFETSNRQVLFLDPGLGICN